MTQQADQPRSETLLTIPQTARYLGVCRAHVYKLIANGLPTIRLGRLVRINAQSLQEWLQAHEDSHRSP